MASPRFPTSFALYGAGVVALSLVPGIVAVTFPRLGILLVGAVLALIVLGFLTRQIMPEATVSSESILLLGALALLMISMVQIERRSPTSADLGTQATFEFVLQGIAVLLVGLAFAGGKLRFNISPPLALWIVVGSLAIASALWAPQAKLALFKGSQLIVVCVVAATAAAQFRDRRQAIRFLAWLVVLVILGMVVYHSFLYGVSSLWEGGKHFWGFGEVGGPASRYRLRLLEVHPITLGGFAGTSALLLLIHRPRRLDWVAFGLLFAVCALTYARVPFLLLCLFSIVFVLLHNFQQRHFRFLAFASAVTASLLLAQLLIGAGDSGSTEPSRLFDFESNDFQTLNGRIPLWQEIIAQRQVTSDTQLNILLGSGYASFRHFGLGLFGYAGEAHNAPFQVFYELGLIGFATWLGAFLLCLRNVWLSVDAALERWITLMPFLYILGLQMSDSNLADSRSFLLILLLFYGHAGLKVAQSARHSTKRITPDGTNDRWQETELTAARPLNISPGNVTRLFADGISRPRAAFDQDSKL